MNGNADWIRDYPRDLAATWNRFWFTPADPATLSAIRVFAGAMLFYTHLVWTLDLESFFGRGGWLPGEVMETIRAQAHPWTGWSIFWHVESKWLLWAIHLAALAVFALLTLGYRSRLMAVLAYLLAISYAGRASSAWFGLDKINCMLAMYLMLGPCGARYSIDRWLARRRENADQVRPAISANVAVRLIQLHLCVIYLFSGLGKLQGTSWWDGTAAWLSVASLEYQSLDLTWLAGWPRLVALLTHLTVFWELFYPVLIWDRRTRPLMLVMAVAVHGGIALGLGMITFGLAMLIANLSFVPPRVVQSVSGWFASRLPVGRPAGSAARRRAVEVIARG